MGRRIRVLWRRHRRRRRRFVDLIVENDFPDKTENELGMLDSMNDVIASYTEKRSRDLLLTHPAAFFSPIPTRLMPSLFMKSKHNLQLANFSNLSLGFSL